jgi:hypothetical protein
MVSQRLKSFVLISWQRTQTYEYFAFSTILYHPLPVLCVQCCLFWTQI